MTSDHDTTTTARLEVGARDACSLGHADLGEQLAGWEALAAGAQSVRRTPSSLRMELDPADRAEAERLVAVEHSCCPFLNITVENQPDLVVITITSPAPETDAVVSFIAKPSATTIPVSEQTG